MATLENSEYFVCCLAKGKYQYDVCSRVTVGQNPLTYDEIPSSICSSWLSSSSYHFSHTFPARGLLSDPLDECILFHSRWREMLWIEHFRDWCLVLISTRNILCNGIRGLEAVTVNICRTFPNNLQVLWQRTFSPWPPYTWDTWSWPQVLHRSRLGSSYCGWSDPGIGTEAGLRPGWQSLMDGEIAFDICKDETTHHWILLGPVELRNSYHLRSPSDQTVINSGS